MIKANVSEIQRFCVHDGPGIRTTVFFQGCPLKCRWCQNPETISAHPVLLFNQDLCAGCGQCQEACSHDAIYSRQDGVMFTDEDACQLCGECCKECYFLSRKLSSSEFTPKQLFEEIIKDETVFKNSAGGVTLSGGEPFMHHTFIQEFLPLAKEAGITTAVETSGYADTDHLLASVPYVDTFLFDMKAYSKDIHEKWTGVSNEKILNNLKQLSEIHKKIIIRIPLIPEVNDGEEEFGFMMDFAESLPGIEEIHILPFHHFGAGKYDLLGLEYEMADVTEENDESLEQCRQIAEAHGFLVSVGGTGRKAEKKNKRKQEMKESFLY